MKSSKSAACIVITVWLSIANSYADSNLKQQFVQKNGVIPKDGYVPKDGFVPDAATAVAVGLAVLTPIYGRDVIDPQKPLKAVLVGDVWVVMGALKSNSVGGVAEINISKKNGAILRVIHGK
ncbi:NTF2 fold immunity protein [Massilia sp. TWR1-2-2]|uniref:NTF2 fold immunity protein n=1 Tax=Massilia sp. TWR1-2-2 TaxID=2804584 RepID=UPI003CEA1E18